MDEQVTRQLVEKTYTIVRERMDGQTAGHGIDHVLRALASAREIQADAGGDLEIVELVLRPDLISGLVVDRSAIRTL